MAGARTVSAVEGQLGEGEHVQVPRPMATDKSRTRPFRSLPTIGAMAISN